MFVMFTLMAGNAALAQTSASVMLVSDYRYRGVALSDDHPQVQMSLAYDNPDGWYAGVFASDTRHEYIHGAQLISYAGYARRYSSTVSWESGASTAHFLQQARYNYTEAYVGLSSENFSARMYFSPQYFGQNLRSLYTEINGAFPLKEHVKMLAHVGYLRPVGDQDGAGARISSRVDTKLGLSFTIADWNAQLAWVRLVRDQSQPSPYAESHPDRKPRSLVFSLSYIF